MGEEGVSNGSGAFAWMINRNWGGGYRFHKYEKMFRGTVLQFQFT
jgi:hypothetical protein